MLYLGTDGLIAPAWYTSNHDPRTPRGAIMSTIEQRRDQMFPKLRPEEIERLRRFVDQPQVENSARAGIKLSRPGGYLHGQSQLA